MKNEIIKSGIYVWKLNDIPKYVGQGLNVKRRMLLRHYECDILKKSINKYGYDAFEKEIICYCKVEKLSELETYYIKELHTHVSEGGYNVSWGGIAPMTGRKHSEKSKQKMSDAIRPSGENCYWFGRKHSKKTKLKMSENHADFSGEKSPNFGMHPSDETRKKMSVSANGKNNAFFGKKRKEASSKYYGVVIHNMQGKYVYWIATVRENNERKYIGQYKTQIEAAQAYDKYVIEHNLNRPLNFPEEIERNDRTMLLNI